MNSKELVKQKDAALETLLAETQTKLQTKRFGAAGAAKDETAVSVMRKTIARIKTILRSRAIAQQTEAAK